MLDRFERHIDYLRISVTDRCNLRCVYCMPEAGVPACSHAEILRYEEILRVVRAAVDLGIHRFRITGGEPLVRLGLVEFVRELAQTPGVHDLAMTTNGTLLAPVATELARAGLRRVNISLDTLRPERFQTITRRGRLEDALTGIEAAHRAGLTPVKINTVVIRDLNDDEVVDLARRALDEAWHLRFIEWMPVGSGEFIHDDWRTCVVTAAEVRAGVESALGPLVPTEGPEGAGPATSYRIGRGEGTIGFIPAVSEHFCDHCNRLRLTADGKLRPCLLADDETDLRKVLREGGSGKDLQALIVRAVGAKPRAHCLAEDARARIRAMAQIGG